MRSCLNNYQDLFVMTVRFLTSAAAMAVAPMVCHAEVFLNTEQAQRLIFPGETLAEASVTLKDAQRRLIEVGSGVKVKDRQVRAWRTGTGGYFFLDTVTGKNEQITYACGITAGGQIKQIEVLEYRESYGHEVRHASWRQQFTGKSRPWRQALAVTSAMSAEPPFPAPTSPRG